jgi:hypothetical protein
LVRSPRYEGKPIVKISRGGEISTNRRDEVEMTALCLHILQASLVMVCPDASRRSCRSRVVALLTPVDRRGLTPLFWLHVRPYGEVRLDLNARLSIGYLGSPGTGT